MWEFNNGKHNPFAKFSSRYVRNIREQLHL